MPARRAHQIGRTLGLCSERRIRRREAATEVRRRAAVRSCDQPSIQGYGAMRAAIPARGSMAPGLPHARRHNPASPLRHARVHGLAGLRRGASSSTWMSPAVYSTLPAPRPRSPASATHTVPARTRRGSDAGDEKGGGPWPEHSHPMPASSTLELASRALSAPKARSGTPCPGRFPCQKTQLPTSTYNCPPNGALPL